MCSVEPRLALVQLVMLLAALAVPVPTKLLALLTQDQGSADSGLNARDTEMDTEIKPEKILGAQHFSCSE